MEQSQLLAHCGTRKLTRAELTAVPTPEGTPTHRPVPHHEIVGGLVETLSFRHIGVVRDEYAVSQDGMKMFGVLDLETASTAAGSRSASVTRTTSQCAWP